MNSLINTLTKLGLLKDDLDYHLIRASMVIVFLFFGYQNGLSMRRRDCFLISATRYLRRVEGE